MPVAKQTLGWIEEKLRRVFNLAGPIGVDLDPVVKPVILVDDLRGPGHAFYQGRSFATTTSLIPAAAGQCVLAYQYVDDVLIERIYLGGIAAPGASVILFTETPTNMVARIAAGDYTGVPAQAFTPCGAWRDRRTVSTDIPPATGNLAFNTFTATTPIQNDLLLIVAVGAVGTPNQTLPGMIDLPIFIPRLGGLGVFVDTWGAAHGTISLQVQARVFPQ